MPGTSSSSTTRTVSATCRPKTTQVQDSRCGGAMLVHIFCEHGPPNIPHTNNGADFSNKTPLAILHRYSKDIHIIGVLMPLPMLYIGKTPPETSIDMSRPREVVLPLEKVDQLEQVLGCRQVIEYVSQDAATPTALPSPTPILLSHLSLQESASDMLLAAVPRPESSTPHPSCSYDLGANYYPNDPLLLYSQQVDSDEDYDSPTPSPHLSPVPHLLRVS